MKRDTLNVIAFVVLVLVFGGCVKVDYSVFKSKYPSAGFGGYIWSRIFQ